MKIAVTVNIGNDENIRIESSEYDEMTNCMEEVDIALGKIREPRVDDFRHRIFGIKVGGLAGGHHPIG